MSAEINEKHRSPHNGTVRLTVLRRPGGRPSIEPHSHTTEGHASHSHHASHDDHHAEHSARFRTERYSMRIPAAPVTFFFAKERLGSGLRSLAAAALAGGMGGFLATQIASTSSLRVQVAVVSIVCLLLGLLMLHYTMRDLLGRLSIDSRGIRVAPGYQGFAVPWNELHRWEVDGLAFRFHTQGSSVAHEVALEVLSHDGRKALCELLEACAPDKNSRRVTTTAKP